MENARPAGTPPSRLWRRLMRLAEIGDTGDGGVNRQAYTDGEAEAWGVLLGWAAEAGLEPSVDEAGNLFMTLPGRDRGLPPAVIGSHIDSQPTGGRFDGPWGVLSALEVVTDMAAEGFVPARDVTVVSWMNEEGSRFAPGMTGSEAFVGLRDMPSIRALRDADGVLLGDALDGLLARFPRLPRRKLGFPIAFLIEPHIEQGTVLEKAGVPIGVVTGMQGKVTFEVEVLGEESHAGTRDMAVRRDAVMGFARIAQAMQRAVGEADPAVKFTIGMLRVFPNAPSVIAGRVVFRIDLRHPDNATLLDFAARLEAVAEAEAAPCGLRMRRLVHAPGNTFDEGLQARLAAAAARLGLASMPVLSPAGHDARHFWARCPTAMIFIPCRDGISHSPKEAVEPAHADAGAAVLAEVVRELCG